MGDEKDSWKVKTLDEILQEKKRRKEQEEKAEIKRMKNSDDRDSKRDSLEEGELRDHRMEITIRNSPYRREDSMEDRGEEDDSLAIKPPQQMSRKEKTHHRKDEKRKEKRRHRSHSAEVSAHHRTVREEYGDKVKMRPWSRSPLRQQRDKLEQGESRKPVKEEKPEERDPLSDLQDISDSERKTSSAESSSESGSGSEEEEEESSSEGSEEEGEEEEEEEETGSNSEEVSEQSAVTESRFDRDSAGSEVEEEEVGEGTPHSNAMTEGDYIPDSPASSPIELKQELPKYLPALQGCRSVEEFQCLNRIEEGTYGVVYRAKDKKTG
ncbi:cyclin-dependent kinase 11b isoform x3 [Limosa lapponica baueri]|uniref:Cyclin-dependent kinase 11b isoform x3 n=1 Tax=Limosa lapponica baueri TaxID=1758121 RepID=A0A2I0TE93_LIMLA|nr:cyclin-dependent kinase 11b isoform x3 [Limosa lapponica baueri]